MSAGSWYALKQHIVNKHFYGVLNSEKHYMQVGEMFACGHCETNVISRQSIRMHLVNHHENEVNISESDILAHCTSTSVATDKEPPQLEPDVSNERPKRYNMNQLKTRRGRPR